MIIKRLRILIYLIGINVGAQSQNQNYWEDIIEQLSVDQENSTNWENEIQELYDKIKEPYNLNTITKEQLESFPFLTDIQIENILAYLYVNGPMKSVYELQLIAEIDWQTIQYLLPFVTVLPVTHKEKYPRLSDIIKYGKNELMGRIDIPFYKRKGYDKKYLGPSFYHSMRYTFQYKNQLYAGIVMEKDGGEPFGALHNKKGYDSYSFYFLITDFRRIKALAIGNYRLSFGQGLVISNNFRLGKTTTLTSMDTRNTGINKHSSTDEYNYFRGIAGTMRIKNMEISAFYSNRSLDGITTEESITSINKTGLHRTQTEADRRGVINQQLTGSNITYRKNQFKAGITGIYYFFDNPYEPQIREYSKYNMRGNNFFNLGIDYRYRWNRLLVFGETAYGKKGGIATLNSIQYEFTNYKIMALYRHYAYDYWAMYARSFSEGTSIQNENGIYLAVDGSIYRNWKLFASVDIFAFPWKKYLVDKPSRGIDGQLQLTYTPIRTIQTLIRYRYKKKEKNYTDKEKNKSVIPYHHHRLRFQIKYTTITIRSRTTIDYNKFYFTGQQASDGYIISQMLGYELPSFPLRFEIQGSYFSTDDYNSRVYMYEKGLLNAFYTPSYQGKGFRGIAHVRWDMNKHVMIIGKIGETYYTDRDEIGSGDDLIQDNKKIDLQIQVRVKF